MGEFEVGLKLRADGQGLTGQLRLTKDQTRQLNEALDDTNRAGRKAGGGLDKYKREASDAERKSRSLKNETGSLSKQFGSLKGILATVGLIAFSRDLLQTTAQIQNIDTRIRGLSGSAAQYADNQKFLIQTARDTRRELVTLSESYSKLLTLQKANIITQIEGRTILEGMIDVQARTGASSTQLGQAMFGMQQGFASGTLRAEELNQIVESLPGLLTELELAADLTGGGFRRMVNEGEVTSQFLKETFVEALEAYEGAAQETFNNLSQLWTSLSTEYTIMAKELQTPLTDSLTPLATGAETLLRSIADNMPFVLDSLSALTDLVIIGGALYLGLKALPPLFAAVAAGATSLRAYAFAVALGATPMDIFNNLLRSGASAATLFSSKMALAKGSMQLLGAAFAGFAFGEWLNNFRIVRTTALRFIGMLMTQFENVKFAGKALWLAFTSDFSGATAAIKLGYAELIEFIGDGLDLIGADQLGASYTAYADELRSSVAAELTHKQSLADLNNEREIAIAKIKENINGFLELEASGTNTVNTNRNLASSIGEVSGGLDNTVVSLAGFTKAQQELIDKMLPLRAAQQKYHADLLILNAIVPQSTEETNLKQQAIANLAIAYVEQVKELDGSITKEKEAARLRKETQASLTKLIETYAPLQLAEENHNAQLAILNLAREEGLISAENYAIALSTLRDEYDDLVDPTTSFLDNLEQEVILLETENEAIRSGNFLRLAEIQLRREGVNVTDQSIAKLAELMARQETAEVINRKLTDQADLFARAWEQSVERADRAWFNFVRSGFDNMKSFKDSAISLAKDLAAELVVIFSRQKLFGGLTGAGGLLASSGAAAATSAGGGGASGSGILSALATSAGGSALIGSAANASLLAGDLLNKVGLNGLSDAAANQGVDLMMASPADALKNIGFSALAGIAGKFTGNAVGEALFGKEAESSIAATIGGGAGAIIGGPLGAFIGSAIGSMVDVAFGGDGMKRFSVGIGAGADPVRGKHISGRSVLDSGLEISHVARRVSDEMLDPLLATYQRIDADFSAITRATGRSLDFSSVQLKGSNADAGSDVGGSFFGLRGENGLPANAEKLLQDEFGNFAKQLIANVPDLSDRVTKAIEGATGDAESILNQYRDLLALDGVFGAGAQIFTDIDSFQETFELFSGALQREGEALGEAVLRIGQSMALLQQVGIGDGSSSAAAFANQVEAEIGLENLQTLVGAYTAIYFDEAERLSGSIDILTEQVSKQFDSLDLSVSKFTSLETFRKHFDAVKDSLDAVDLSKYLQAAIGLAQLIDLREQETAAISQTTAAVSQLSTMVSDIDAVVNQARSLSASLNQDILKLRGAIPLHPVLGVGLVDERLVAVQELQRIYEQQHAEQVSATTSLHDLEMAQYQQRLEAQVSLDKFIRELSFSNIAPVSAGERLQLAGQEFSRLVNLAKASGDATTVGDAQTAARTYIDIARTQFASGQAFVDIFEQTRSELTDLSNVLLTGGAPGALDISAADNLLIAQLESLRAETISIQQQSTFQVVDQLALLNSSFNSLSDDIRAQLTNIISNDQQANLAIANGFGLLRADVVGALGLLPTTVDLSQVGIANALESLTSIGQFDAILGAGLGSLSDIMGAVASQLLAMGVSSHLLADIIAQNSTLLSAANQFLAQSGSSQTVADFQSSVNNNISNSDIANFLATQPVNNSGAAAAIQWAIDNNVGSAQLAASGQGLFPGITQQEIIDISRNLGFGSFRSGTDRITGDGLNFNHEDEIIFSPQESNTLRSKVIQIVDQFGKTGGGPDTSKVVAAIMQQSDLMDRISQLNHQDSVQNREQMAVLITELQEEMEALRREVEEQAA